MIWAGGAARSPRDGRADGVGTVAADALTGDVGAAQRRGGREDAEVRIAEELAGLGLFRALGEADIAALAEVCFVRRLARGQVLFLAGEPSEHLCVVRSGLLRVVTSSPHGDQFVLSTVAPGQTLGELSILDGKPALGRRGGRRGNRAADGPGRRGAGVA